MTPPAPDAPTRQQSFRIRGRVQGVGFRWWTRAEALRLELSGDVRNLPDGSVLVRARGASTAIDALRCRLQEGPPGAEVSQVQDEPVEDVPEGSFEIAR